MFENAMNADETVSRRSVLKTAGGLIAGSTALASLGAEGGAALPNFDDFIVEVQEMNEEYIAVEVWFPSDTFDGGSPGLEFPTDTFLGLADRFLFHEDGEWISLPEDTEGLARPAEVRSIESESETYHGKLMYFRAADLGNVWDRLADGEEVTLGLGIFTERTIPRDQWGHTTVSDLAY